MEIIVYYPTTKKGWDDLSKRVASVHAEHAIKMVDRLNCPLEQKLALIDTAVKRIQQREEK